MLKYYLTWDNLGNVDSITTTAEPNREYTECEKNEDGHFQLYTETNDFTSAESTNLHYVSLSSFSNELYVISFCDGDGGGKRSYHSLLIVETFEAVIDYVKSDYDVLHQDDSCDLCQQPDGAKRCLLSSIGKLAEDKTVSFGDEEREYTVSYKRYCQRVGTKRKLVCDSSDEE